MIKINLHCRNLHNQPKTLVSCFHMTLIIISETPGGEGILRLTCGVGFVPAFQQFAFQYFAPDIRVKTDDEIEKISELTAHGYFPFAIRSPIPGLTNHVSIPIRAVVISNGFTMTS